MNKPKFRMTVQEMLDFNDDCNNAAGECPQYRGEWAFEDRDIFEKRIRPKQLLKHWKASSVLFDSGYHVHLSEASLDWFQKYALYKAEKRSWKSKQPTASAAMEES